MDGSRLLGRSLVVATSAVIGLGLVTFFVRNPLVRDVGIAVSERDQHAALLIEVATLSFTAAYIICSWITNKKTRDEDIEELQALGGTVYDSLANAKVTEI